MKSFIAATLVVVALAAPAEQNAQSQCINKKIEQRKDCDIKTTAALKRVNTDRNEDRLAAAR